MPKFRKTIDELVDNTDRWLFVLKNLSRLQKYPEKLQSKIFQKLFNEAEIAKYSMDDFMAYQNSLNDYRNNKASIETARIEGQDEGMDIFAALVKILSDAGRYNDIARVSTDKEEQINSLENQVAFFEEYIKKNTNWTYVGGYVDEGISRYDFAKT